MYFLQLNCVFIHILKIAKFNNLYAYLLFLQNCFAITYQIWDKTEFKEKNKNYFGEWDWSN